MSASAKRKPEDWQQSESTVKRRRDDAHLYTRQRMSAKEIAEKLDQWVRSKRAKDFFSADRIRDELRKEGIEAKKIRPADKNLQASQAGETDRQLKAWDQAKKNGDEATASRLADLLRLKGVEATPGREFLVEQLKVAKAANDHIAANRLQLEMQRIVENDPTVSRCGCIEDMLLYFCTYSHLFTCVCCTQGPASSFTPPLWRPPSQATAYAQRRRMGYTHPGQRLDHETERQLDEWVQAKRAKDFKRSDRIRDALRRKNIEAKHYRPEDANPWVRV